MSLTRVVSTSLVNGARRRARRVTHALRCSSAKGVSTTPPYSSHYSSKAISASRRMQAPPRSYRDVGATVDLDRRIEQRNASRVGAYRRATGDALEREAAFTGVYKRQQWGQEGAGSGSGSSEVNAAGASRILFHVIMMFNINSVIDAPCGGMIWQAPLLNQLVHAVPGFRYLGVDVVGTVISRNGRKFSSKWSVHKNVTKVNPGFAIQFAQADLASKDWYIPAGFDLIFCRDALQHNRLSDVWRIMRHFADSDAKYVLVGSYPDGSMYCRYTEDGSPNINLARTGGFFCVDLLRAPFNLSPTKVFREGTHDRKTLYLFERSVLQRQLQTKQASVSQ